MFALKCLSIVPNDFQGNVNDSNAGVNESISRKQFAFEKFWKFENSVTLNGVPNKSL